MTIHADGHTDYHPDALTDGHTDGPGSVRERFRRVVVSMQKPKPGGPGRGFRSITNDERRMREQLVAECVNAHMAAEQMVDFLPTWGVRLSRSQVYEYLSGLKLPRNYRRSESEQSHHDYYTLRFFIRLAQDAALAGQRTRKLLKGRLAWEGMRFKPDFKFEVRHYQFFMEVQLSDLTETRWTVKFANYYRLAERTGLKFRVLFVIDQAGDMNYVRRFARQFLEKRGRQKCWFLFLNLADLKGSGNLAMDEAWWTPWGKKESLLQWLGSPGQNPAVQC